MFGLGKGSFRLSLCVHRLRGFQENFMRASRRLKKKILKPVF